MLRACAIAFLSWVLVSWTIGLPPKLPPKVNVILITVDTLRPDRLSSYGYDRHRTPNIDRLATEGMLFENAFCDVTWTTPSMASVMTGRYTPTHGLRTSAQRLGDDAITLAELLSSKGVTTAAIVASYPLDSIYGLDQGFGLYDDTASLPTDPRGAPVEQEVNAAQAARERQRTEMQWQMGMFMVARARHDAYRPDDELSDRAIRWLQEERREPFFLWLHYFGPHEKPQSGPFDHDEWVKRYREDYDPDVVKTDEQIGRLLSTLETLGLLERTAVILHADHGQSLTEHNYFGHGMNVFDPTQRVPLLMRLPGRLPAGVRVSRLVRNVDLFPTILELMNVRVSVPIDGQKLWPAPSSVSTDDEAYVETYLPASLFFGEIRDAEGKVQLGYRRLGVRTARWKFIINDPAPLSDVSDSPPITDEIRRRYYFEELYDLQTDPGETTNVIQAQRDVGRQLLQTVMRYQATQPLRIEPFELDESSRERLRALGYIQ